MSEKKSLEEQAIKLETDQTGWIEPMREWLKEAQTGEKIARDYDLAAKKVIAKKMFGSNLLLTSQNLSLKPLQFEGEKSNQNKQKSPPNRGKNINIHEGKNPWDALRIAIDSRGKIEECLLMERVAGVEPACRVWKTPIITVI